ncbi:MAG: contractile injection system protein, VgrG/Pvc8 family [Lacrimispora sp.]|uniref:contractile injection system protein, VgrG/Pvc8 family n=1 Tax=Lacrimispora sp. TaxID=2719234 RepID=UPI0039E2C141
MAYALDQICIEGLTFEKLEELKIECRPGEHGSLYISGFLAEDKGKSTLFEMNEYAPISVSVQVKGKKQTIFAGVMTEAVVQGSGAFHHIEVKARTYSLFMDLKKKSRSFQNTAMTYGQLIHAVLADYPGSDINLTIEDKPLGEISVQYRETDWVFLKRMLSQLNAPLACYPGMEQIKLYGGIPSMAQGAWGYKRVRAEKEMGVCNYWQQQGAAVGDVDFLIYTIETDHTPELFEQINYQGESLRIRGFTYTLEQGLLYCRCELQKQTGILEAKQYPMHLIGAALEGKILDVAGEKVKAQLMIDGENSQGSVYWFPYSTLSASPDGSGWYYMPERGDHVRIYFPSKHTKDVIAVSSVSDYDGTGGGGSGGDRMGSPSTKYLSNVHGQEMSLGEDGVNLTCAGGAASLKIGKDGKVSLSAQSEVMVGAQNNIDITAETDVVLHGSKCVSIMCSQGGQIQAAEDGNLYIKGTEVKID